MSEKIKSIYAKFCNLELILGAICLGTTVTIITLSAILRTIGFPINWALDIALWLFTWSVFLGADTALRADKMVNVDILVKRLPEKARKVIQLIVYLIILCFLGMLTVLGFKLSYLTRFRTFQGIPGMSYTWVTLCIPFCSLFMIVTTCIKIRQLLAPGMKKEATE